MQRYCPSCSEKRDQARKDRWHLDNGKKAYSARQEQFSKNGTEISRKERISIFKTMAHQPDLAWVCRVAVPFSWAGSKNHIFANTARGHVFMRSESRAIRAEITDRIRKAVKDQEIKQNKIWIDIFVQKPNHRGDAANFVDLVCDAVKDAIPLDDRWFSIRRVDWQICKHQPMIYVGLGQEWVEDVQACSTCGRLLPFRFFQKNRSAANGVTRNCRDCQSVKRKDGKVTYTEYLPPYESGAQTEGVSAIPEWARLPEETDIFS